MTLRELINDCVARHIEVTLSDDIDCQPCITIDQNYIQDDDLFYYCKELLNREVYLFHAKEDCIKVSLYRRCGIENN